MKILVTGGAGFIGSNFIRLIQNKYPHYQIINIDKLTYAGNPENIKDLNITNILGEKGDICNIENLNKIFQTYIPDAIVNFAAESHVDNSIDNSSEFIKTNVLGVDNLLKLSLKHNVKKFIQVSTDEVYGSLTLDEPSKKEADKLKPSSPYSASKAAAELLALSYFQTHSLPVIITRGANTYGPYHHPEKLIPKFITNLIQGKKVPLMGEGKEIRDWLHVYDHCSAIDTLLHNGKPGEIYNISPDNEKTNKEITISLLKAFNFGEEMIQQIEHRKGHDFRYSIESKKLKELGWELKYNDFDSALNEVINWYKQNEDWWKPLLKDVKY
ncbi:dTDP-glucose 4,6-dehydratase [archaeon]|nr:dTDP-glucose 4,6-dehydratase [archaeon]